MAVFIREGGAMYRVFHGALIAGLMFVVSACSGGGGGNRQPTPMTPGSAMFTVSGTVSGLTGSGLILQNNGGGNLVIAGNGAFTFAAALPSGSNYSVAASGQP